VSHTAPAYGSCPSQAYSFWIRTICTNFGAGPIVLSIQWCQSDSTGCAGTGNPNPGTGGCGLGSSAVGITAIPLTAATSTSMTFTTGSTFEFYPSGTVITIS
jgi:hypothetical protein